MLLNSYENYAYSYEPNQTLKMTLFIPIQYSMYRLQPQVIQLTQLLQHKNNAT